jgi:hypothetical protein
MRSEIVTDSVRDAWRRTRGLLLVRPRVGHWLKLGFIAMLGASALSGGGDLNLWVPGNLPTKGGGRPRGPGGFEPQTLQGLRDGLIWLADHLGGLIAVIVGLLVVGLLLAVAIVYIRAVFRFIFVDAVAAPHEPSIRASWSRHTGLGLSLLLWYIFLELVASALMVMTLLPLIAAAVMIGSGRALPAILGIGGFLGLFGLVLLIALLLMLLKALTDDLLVPAMYVRHCGVWEGWQHVRRAWRGQFWNVVLYYLLKLVASIGAAIARLLITAASMALLVAPVICAAMIVMLIAGAVAQIGDVGYYLIGPAVVAAIAGAVVYSYLLEVLLLPISVFFQAYALSFVGKLDPSLRTI